MWFIGVEVEKRRVHPLLKKILDPPLQAMRFSLSKTSMQRDISTNTIFESIPHFLINYVYTITYTIAIKLIHLLVTYRTACTLSLIKELLKVFYCRNVLPRHLGLSLGNFFNEDPGHRLPARVGVTRCATRTITNPKSHAHLSFVNVVTMPLNMANAVKILSVALPHVHHTVNG